MKYLCCDYLINNIDTLMLICTTLVCTTQLHIDTCTSLCTWWSVILGWLRTYGCKLQRVCINCTIAKHKSVNAYFVKDLSLMCWLWTSHYVIKTFQLSEVIREASHEKMKDNDWQKRYLILARFWRWSSWRMVLHTGKCVVMVLKDLVNATW